MNGETRKRVEEKIFENLAQVIGDPESLIFGNDGFKILNGGKDK